MKKKTLIIFLALSLILIIFTIFLFSTSKTSEAERKTLITMTVKGQNYKIDISYFPANASAQDGIYVRKIYSDDREILIDKFPRYDHLMKYSQVSDSLIQITLLNTRHPESGAEIFNVRIK